MKKSHRTILIAAAALLILWGLLFAVDYNAVMNLKDPIIARHIGAEGGTYRGLGWTVEIEKRHYTEDGGDLGWITESAEISFFGIPVGGAIT